MLRRFADRIGFSSHFTIYDSDDSKRVMKECQKELGIEDKMLSYKTLLSHISKAKDMLITPEEYERENAGDVRLSSIAKAYKLYQQKLKKADAMDFDDIIVWTVRLFEQSPDVLSFYQHKFKYIMVDEYQGHEPRPVYARKAAFLGAPQHLRGGRRQSEISYRLQRRHH